MNHLERPAAGLAELRRVTRPGGTVLVSVFATARSAAKTVVDAVGEAYGYVAPSGTGKSSSTPAPSARSR